VQVILLEKVRNLGELGDQVKVTGGYGRNFLLPQKKAVPATASNVANFDARRAELEKALAEVQAKAEARKAEFEQFSVTITARSANEGKLFGSVGTREITEAATAAGKVIQKSEVRLPDGPIRFAGEHEVTLQLHNDVATTIVVNVVADEA
jgi:large subunit ribosomal protein L9